VGEAILESYEMAGEPGRGARLLLENTAGAGRSYGATFGELGAAICATGLDADRIGVCLDTCHAFAYGMPLDSQQGWQEVLGGIDALCGPGRLGLIHGNDCMFERGSRRDRHAWIGDGFIGYDGFAAMVCAPQLADVPICSEMPGDVPIKDEENIRRLVGLRDQCDSSQPTG
jgi:deoxyribonuclease-4